MTTAEAARRQMFADYSSKAGVQSQACGRGHRLTDDDRRRAVRRRRLNAMVRADIAPFMASHAQKETA